MRTDTQDHEGELPQSAWRDGMIRAQAGDKQAYARLLQSLVPELERFVRARLRDPTASEDVVQNILLGLHRARHTYRPERAFEPWIFAIARNAVIDFQRKRKVRKRFEQSLEGVPEPSCEAEPEGRNPGVLSPELIRALEQLPAAQREAVELIKLQGLSVAEAAARAGTSAGALKVRAHRGYRALRAILQDVGSLQDVGTKP